MSEWGREGGRAGGSSGGRVVVAFLALAAIAVAGADIASRLGYFTLPFSASGESETLREQVAALQQQLAEARERAESLPSVDTLYREIEQQNAEIARLKDERDALRAGESDTAASLRIEIDQLRKVQIPSLENELAARDASLKSLEARLKLAEQVTRDLEAQPAVEGDTVAALRADLEKRDAALKALDSEIARLSPMEAELNGLKKQSDAAKAELASLRGELARAREAEAREVAKAKALGSQVAALQTELDTQKAALEAARKPADASAAAQKTVSTNARQLTPRDPQRVADAVLRAQGLSAITDSQRDRIATGLIEGECVGKVLSDIIGRAPAVTTRDLIRSLQSDC